MKLKSGLILRKVANQYIIVPTGKRTREIPTLVYISSSAAYLWDFMQEKEFTEADLADLIMAHYTGVTREQAEGDVHKFLDVLKRNSILEPEPGEPAATGGWVRVTFKDD